MSNASESISESAMSGKTELLITFGIIISVGLLLNISLVLDRIETLLKDRLPKK